MAEEKKGFFGELADDIAEFMVEHKTAIRAVAGVTAVVAGAATGGIGAIAAGAIVAGVIEPSIALSEKRVEKMNAQLHERVDHGPKALNEGRDHSKSQSMQHEYNHVGAIQDKAAVMQNSGNSRG